MVVLFNFKLEQFLIAGADFLGRALLGDQIEQHLLQVRTVFLNRDGLCPINGSLAELFFENKTLFDLTSDQQNILHVKVGDERKSLLLFSENPNGVLNFN